MFFGDISTIGRKGNFWRSSGSLYNVLIVGDQDKFMANSFCTSFEVRKLIAMPVSFSLSGH